MKNLANSSLSPGGYLLTQIPIIDGLRRSTDYDDDLGYGRTYDEFGDEYDISTVGPTPLTGRMLDAIIPVLGVRVQLPGLFLQRRLGASGQLREEKEEK